MEVETIKMAITKELFSRNGLTFVDLEKIEGFTGDKIMGYVAADEPQNRNLVLWDKVSENGTKALTQLINEKQIRLVHHTLNALLYYVDNTLLDLPIAPKVDTYTSPHWLPVYFTSTEKDVKTIH